MRLVSFVCALGRGLTEKVLVLGQRRGGGPPPLQPPKLLNTPRGHTLAGGGPRGFWAPTTMDCQTPVNLPGSGCPQPRTWPRAQHGTGMHANRDLRENVERPLNTPLTCAPAMNVYVGKSIIKSGRIDMCVNR